MSKSIPFRFIPSLLTLLSFGGSAEPAPAIQNYAALPLSFEARAGAYVARGQGYSISLGASELTIGLRPSKNLPGGNIQMQLVGGRQKALGTPENQLPGKVNYILGKDPAKWELGLPTFERVRYRDLYPGVDVVYYGNQQHLEFDFEVAPGAKPESIRLKFQGANSVTLNESGEIVLENPAGEFRLQRPVVYQEIAGKRQKVEGSYKKLASGELAFSLGSFDRSRRLIIDPTIVYSTFLGGGAQYIGGGTPSTFPQAIAINSNNAYIAGYTYAADFPTASAAFATYRGGADGFVAQMNSTGTALVYSTYLGGSGDDSFFGIAVDGSGAAWVVGYSDSSDFPTMNPYQGALAGSFDVVVAKLSASGSLLFSTYLGGPNYDYGSGIGLDPMGNAYVTGYASTGFPTTSGVIATVNQGSSDAFVTKFSSAGSLSYSTYLGGAATDYGFAIAADSNGDAYIAGATYSNQGFRGAPGGGAQPNYINNGDAFIAKLNPAATAVLYFTYLGGSAYDQATSIAVDSTGNAYVAGETSSIDFPATQSALQTTLNGGTNGFAAKLNPTGTAFSYTTYIGSNRTDSLHGLALDPSGNVYLAGDTNGDQFPVSNALQGTLPGPSTSSLYQTTNSGAAWAAFESGLRGTVNSLSPDPTAASTLVASTDVGLFKTTNNGGLWTLENATPLVYFSRSPVSSNIIYGVNGSSAYKSTDGGTTWNRTGSIGQCCGTAPVADPLTANTAYVYYNSGNLGIIKSTDGGVTWNPANSGLPTLLVQSLAAGPDGSLYAALKSGGVYTSTNQGTSWTAISTGLPPSFAPNTIVVSASSASVLYVSDSANVYKTTNAGSNWALTASPVPSGSIATIGVSPLDSQNVFAASAFAPVVFRSPDGGTTWNGAASGLGNAPPSQFVFSPINSGQVFALETVNTASWLAKLNAAGTALVYGTFLGGSNGAYSATVATNGTGDAFVSGYTFSPDFPISQASYTTSYLGSGQGFVMRVSDATAACSYSVNPGNQLVYGSQQSVIYNIVAPAGCVWSAASNQNWATVTAGISGAGVGSVVVQTAGNSGGTTRSATLTIAGQNIALSQASSGCSYALSYNGAVAAAGGSVPVQLTTGGTCDWNVAYQSNGVVAAPLASTGSGTITLSVAANPNLNARTLTLLIGNQPVTLSQSGTCTFNVTPSLIATSGIGVRTVQVTTTSSCSWSGRSTLPWATISGSSGTTGSGSVIFDVVANPGPGMRTGTVTVAGQSVTLMQVAPANTNAGIFRDGFFWILDVDGNELFDNPPDLAFPFGGIAGDIPIIGDWNGDGHTKVGVYRTANGYFILDTNGDGVIDAGDAFFNLGVGMDPTDIPVVGDWNGDGRTKVGLFRQGFEWLLDYNGDQTYSGPPNDRAYFFGGISGDLPVTGDWTGSGTSKIGIFRQGFFWVLDANGNGTFDGTGAGQDYAFPYGGISQDLPVVGDWNGTGITKVGVFREGFFWVLDGNNPGDSTHSVGLAFPFGGISGDKPVAGKW